MDVRDAWPKYIKIGGHALDLEDDTNKSAVAKREEGEKENTYESSGTNDASLSSESESQSQNESDHDHDRE